MYAGFKPWPVLIMSAKLCAPSLNNQWFEKMVAIDGEAILLAPRQLCSICFFNVLFLTLLAQILFLCYKGAL
jgi:hypothetical protein